MSLNPDAHIPGRFKLQIEGRDAGSFSEATLPDIGTPGSEYRHEAPNLPFKRPGPLKQNNLTLRRGLVKGLVLQQWQDNIAQGKQDRRAISVILLNDEGGETLRWNMFNCWPVKYMPADQATATDEYLVEGVEMAVERIEQIG
jgi:phage tail-like protein